MNPNRSKFIQHLGACKHLVESAVKKNCRTVMSQNGTPGCSRSRDLQTQIIRLQKNLTELAKSETVDSPVFRDNVILRINNLNGQVQEIASGKLTFESTETWRSVYEDILDSVKTKTYFSVALIRSEDYWRDQPGISSLDFNYRLLDHGFYIHRLFIIDDFFWAPSVQTPAKQVHNWITGQKQRGIDVTLVRLSALDDEPHLVCDFGIYGEDAVGFQETDFEGRTTRFELQFNRQQVKKARQHWEQLKLYSKSYSDIITVR